MSFTLSLDMPPELLRLFFGFYQLKVIIKTQRKKRYLAHLFGFAILMSVGNYLLNALFVAKGLPAMQQPFNIFWSLALGVWGGRLPREVQKPCFIEPLTKCIFYSGKYCMVQPIVC